jgi:hypothetical protein
VGGHSLIVQTMILNYLSISYSHIKKFCLGFAGQPQLSTEACTESLQNHDFGAFGIPRKATFDACYRS